MSQDNFDVNRVATCKHDNEVECSGIKRDPFSIAFPTTKLPFQVFSTGIRPIAEKGLEK